jgi:hypothetical protein
MSNEPESRERMKVIKETLKVRFEQHDIWITAHQIEIF